MLSYGVERSSMTEQELIERAIESAKCRIYRVRDNAKGRTTSHQRIAENQAELQKVTINALEKQIAKKLHNYYCPICRYYFEDGEPHKYCPECGQRLGE